MKSTFNSRSSTSSNGSWKPYIPQIGTPHGCRTAIRSSQEKFYITHSAKVLSDLSSESRRVYNESPAASCSLTGSATFKEGGTEDVRVGRRISPIMKNTSIGIGCSPSENEKLFAKRPQQGRIHEESQDCMISSRDETRARTIKPPDNLSVGLHPIVDYEAELLQVNRCSGIRNNSSLGPGLQPIGLDESHSSISEACPMEREYKRFYGIIR